MRQQYQKMKSNPFSSVSNRKSKAHNRSIEQYELMESFNNNQKLVSEAVLKNKVRQKSFSRRRDSNLKGQIALDTSVGDLGKQLKEKRNLIEQNEELKKKIETLILSNPRKKTPTKRISTQFQKQLYWNGSQSYMITGIKFQYQKMKESLMKKNEAYEELMRSTPISKNMEFLTYIETLQVQNFIISRQLQAMTVKNSQSNNDDLTILQLQDRIANYEISYAEQRKINKKKNGQIKKLKSKISFLQTLIITKDNNEHCANKQLKKIEKQKIELQNRIKQLEQQINKLKKQHTKQKEKMESSHRQNLQSQLKKIVGSHKQQYQTMLRLQRENRHLHNLVQSWKAQKVPNKHQRQHKHHTRDQINSNNSSFVKDNLNKSKYDLTSIEKVTPKKNTEKQFQPLKKQYTEQASLQLEQPVQNRRTTPYNPDNKNSQNAIKNRRVQAYQIEEIIEFSRFRMISQQRSIEWIVSQFECISEDQWQKQYINMGQARNIIQTKLLVCPQQASLFARYLIQHSNLQYVYTDDLNQHPRAIVKSILRALYGNYSIYTEQRQQFNSILQGLRNKLELMLQSSTKGGVISKDKFTEIVESLSIDCKSGFDIYCISKMVKYSQSLQRLRFKHLLEDIPKND